MFHFPDNVTMYIQNFKLRFFEFYSDKLSRVSDRIFKWISGYKQFRINDYSNHGIISDFLISAPVFPLNIMV